MRIRSLKWLGVSAVVLVGLLAVAPSAVAASDAGYSATCKDGTAWNGSSKRGACRGHKGVKSWSSEGGSTGATEDASKASRSRRKHSKKADESTAATSAADANATGGPAHSRKSRHEAAAESTGGAVSATCKDGTAWSGKSKRGACRGHKGVANWSGAAAATAPAAAPAPHETEAAPAPAPRQAPTRTASTGGSLGSPAAGGGNGKVWVNTSSKTYHCPGSKWYGTTKHGEYMTESQASAQGYHADHGKACSK